MITVESDRDRPHLTAAGTLPKIAYVGGFSRSGSTLVGRVLGEGTDAICVGETRYLWDRGLIHNVQCGCGHPFRSCPFWCAVGEEAFGGWGGVDTGRLAQTDQTINRLRALPFHWLPSLRPALSAAIADYISHLARLYVAIARVSGAKTIVETSKDPNFGSLLTQMPDYDVRIIHLIRDSRAVAYSWTHPKRLSSPIGEHSFMPTFRPADTAIRWLIANIAFHGLAGRAAYTRCNYEDFIADPQAELDALICFLDNSPALSDTHLAGDKVKLGEHHIFSGNPMRDRTGWITIQPDDRWRTALSARQLVTVTTVTWPLLRLYGYPITSTSPRHAT